MAPSLLLPSIFPDKPEVCFSFFPFSVSNSGPRPTQMTLVPFVQLLNDGPDWRGRRGETDVNRKRGFRFLKLYIYTVTYTHAMYIFII